MTIAETDRGVTSGEMRPAETARYVTLDGMRGIAAVAVAVFHFDRPLASGGYLAVDFFFALSGFVLARAYGARLSADGGVRRFIEARFIRLYPIFLAGILLGAVHTFQLIARGGAAEMTYMEAARATLLGCLMLPDVFSSFLYPVNIVFWSIAAEIVVNIVFSLVIVGLPTRIVLLLVLLCGLLLFCVPVAPDYLNAGVLWSGAVVGLIRTGFSFGVGVIVARKHIPPRRRVSNWAIVLMAILLIPLLAPISVTGQYWFELAVVIVLFPLLLWAGAQVEPTRWVTSSAALLGDVSYALYAIHQPVQYSVMFIVRRYQLPMSVALPVFMILSVCAAAAIVHLWDKPARRWLDDWLGLRRSAMPQKL